MADLNKELKSVWEEMKGLKKVKEELITENTKVWEWQFNKKNKQLLKERESFASLVEYLQVELTQNQMSSK